MKTRSFTLIEILVALAVISIIAGFVFVYMAGAIDSVKDMKRKADMEVIKNALVQYRSEHYSIVPAQATFCEIGNNCPNLDSALQPFLVTVPKDLNGTSYSYQSASSTDCTILANLSDGSVYKYDCGTDSFSVEAVVNGDCGISSAYELNGSTPGLCDTGTVNSFSGTGPWNWNCLGANRGSNASCIASAAPASLVCSVGFGGCGGATILRLEDPGHHAEHHSQSHYSYRLCCTGADIFNDCSNSHKEIVLKLSSLTHAHVEKKNYDDYPSIYDACLSSKHRNVSCAYATDCSSLGGGYVCLVSISGDTNAYVGDCTVYPTKVCCKVY